MNVCLGARKTYTYLSNNITFGNSSRVSDFMLVDIFCADTLRCLRIELSTCILAALNVHIWIAECWLVLRLEILCYDQGYQQ